MDYKLERKILFKTESEHKSLYSWCLNEIDESGKNVGRDLIPWSWSLNFTASLLRVVRETSIRVNSGDDSSFFSEASQSTRIIGTLHSGYPADGGSLYDDVTFSFLGTKRNITKFSLSISPAQENDKDLCSVVAIPSYETEIDFRNHTEDDFLGFDVLVKKEFFDQLVHAIEVGSADAVTMRVGLVRGFYSEWSPSISTYFIKVLAPGMTVDGVEDGEFTPPTTSFANDFSLTICRVNRLNLKNGFSLNQHDAEFFEKESFPATEDEPSVLESNESKGDEYFRSAIGMATKLTSSLKLPLWAIFVVLVLLLFK